MNSVLPPVILSIVSLLSSLVTALRRWSAASLILGDARVVSSSHNPLLESWAFVRSSIISQILLQSSFF